MSAIRVVLMVTCASGVACRGADQILASGPGAVTTGTTADQDSSATSGGDASGGASGSYSGTNACEQCVLEHCWPLDEDCGGPSCACWMCLETAWDVAQCVEACTQQPEPFELWMCVQEQCMEPCSTADAAAPARRQ